jgi:chloramphenicol 3-O-phosphotransferase
MATLYDLIAELRREHPTPSAARTLDMVVAELGETRDNLRQALQRLEERPVPLGGRAVLDELAARARLEGVDDLTIPYTRTELREISEPVDSSQVGIAVLLGGSALMLVGLAAAAFVAGLLKLLHG